MKKIKQYGLQRSGTNYLRWLMEANYRVRVLVNIGIWKHGFFNAFGVRQLKVPAVLITKHPLSWLDSIYRYMIQHPLQLGIVSGSCSFQDFVRSVFVMRGKAEISGRDVCFEMRAASPVEYWNNYHWHWLTVDYPQPVLFVRYEDLIDSPEHHANLIAERFSLQRAKGRFMIPENRIMPGDDKNKNISSSGFDSSFYSKKRYLDLYSAGLLDFIGQQLDDSVMRRLGYSLSGTENR